MSDKPTPMSRQTVLMVGLPSSGKTSYLASCWHALGQHRRATRLSLSRLPPNAESLNRITEAWLACQPPDHTSTGSIFSTVLDLQEGHGAPFELVMPDYSGEFVRDSWIHRRWPPDMVQHLRDAHALILFVHPAYLIPHETVEAFTRRAGILEAGAPDSSLQPKPFDMAQVPSQTMLVEFLQFARLRAKAKVLPVSFIVSAWDLVAPEGKTPSEWLASNLPLVDQFLAANMATLPSALFGVSAQGADWPSAKDQSRKLPAEERSSVVDGDGKPGSDVTIPISWAMSET
jgi:hypothetical protein